MKPIYAILVVMAFFAASATTDAAEKAPTAKSQTHCPVTGEELGSMGKPVTVKHGGKTIKLCCKPCVKKFKADPEKYLKRLK